MATKAERKFYAGDIGGGSPKFEAVLGFTKIGDQDPYFLALAGEWDQRERCFASCANHTLLAERFPEHAALAKWHLVSLHDGPMHYEANAIFWAEMAQGKRERASYDHPIDAFKRTVVFGASLAHDGNSLDAGPMKPWTWTNDAIRSWLRERKPALMAKFREEIDAAFPTMWAAAEAL